MHDVLMFAFLQGEGDTPADKAHNTIYHSVSAEVKTEGTDWEVVSVGRACYFAGYALPGFVVDIKTYKAFSKYV